MSKLGKANFEGKTGAKYSFNVHISDTTFWDIGAVYIFGDTPC